MKDKQRRFPFFTLPMPEFLKRDLRKMEDFVVLLRITPKITLHNYIDAVYILAIFLVTAIFLAWDLVLSLSSNLPAVLLAFLWRYGWLYFVSLFTGSPLSDRLQRGALVLLLVLLFLMAVHWIVDQTRRAIRELRGLRKLHTMTEEERAQFSLQQFLRVSLPTWLSTSISYEPTPEEVLALLREREQVQGQQTRARVATLLHDEDETTEDEEHEEEPEESSSASSLVVTLTDRIILSILTPFGKVVKVQFTDAVAALVGFLATRRPGEWLLKEDVLNEAYGGKDGDKDHLFGVQRARVDQQIITWGRKEGVLITIPKTPTESASAPDSVPADETEEAEQSPAVEEASAPSAQEQEQSIEVRLLENQQEGQRSSWRLIPSCTTVVYPFLTSLYADVMRAQALPEDPTILRLDALRQGCDRLMEEYGEGFLGKHMRQSYVWPWAIEQYRKYREQCLSILLYANQREQEALETCSTRQEREAVIERIAKLYKRQAMVAIGPDVMGNGEASEHDMESCLYYYGEIKQQSLARAAYQDYCNRRSQFDPTYEPGETLKARAEAVIPPPRRSSRSRKTTKNFS